MANVWATKAGNSSDNTVWNTGAQPTINDIVYSNGFAISVNNNLQFAKLSNAANAGIGVSAGGTFTLAQNYVCTGDLEKNSTSILLITAAFGFINTGAITNGGNGLPVIDVTGSAGTSNIVLNITNYTVSLSAPAIRLANTQTAIDVTINLSSFTIPQTLIGNSTANVNMNVYINGTHQQSTAAYCTNVGGSQKFHLNGVVYAGEVALLSGITGTNYATVDAINLENMTVFPITGSGSSIIKFNAGGTNYIRANFSDSTVKNMSLVADLPPENKVEKDYVYDFGLKTGEAWRAPDEAVSLGVPNWDSVGTAIFTGVIK